MYQALYRKWRPKTFADVVGQAHITETLRRQVAQGRLSHAYLFTGTRGTGKTTCAKILAKAVNCQNSVDGDPCGVCPACQGIDNGSLLDVMELDAASNNGVDHVRALRDEAIYSPASVRYRVYIVDEVHMLSTAAFNALLKILEEPPAHLIFILATTELHKVPATILSRCQRFAFKRIRPQDIEQRLLFVASQEGIDLTGDAAGLLSRLSDGALRDALSLLDQCSGAGGTIDTDRVLDVLGLAGSLQTAELMGCVLRRDVQAALLLLHQLYTGGKDIAALLGELSSLTRDLLIRMTAPEGGAALLSGSYDTALMDSLAQGVSPNRLLYMASQLQASAAALPLSVNRRTDAELCLMRLCDESLCGDVTALAARLSRLEDGAPPASVPAPAPTSAQPKRKARPASKPAQPPKEEPPAAQPKETPSEEGRLTTDWQEVDDAPPWDDVPPPPEEAPPEVITPLPPEPPRQREAPPSPKPEPAPQRQESGDFWPALSERIKNRLSARYWFHLDDTEGVLEGDVLVVRCKDDFTLENLNNRDVSEAVQAAAAEQLGRDVAVRFRLRDSASSPPVDKMEELIRLGSKYDCFVVK